MQLVRFITASALVAMAATPAMAQQDTTHGAKVSTVAQANTKKRTKAEKRENLKALAKISRDSARTIALGKVAAGSKVRSSELEREKGVVVYSFDIKVPKQSGVEEILVSAIDGTVVSQMHESAKYEKAEAAREKRDSSKKP